MIYLINKRDKCPSKQLQERKLFNLTFGFKGYAYLFFIEFIRPQQMSLAKLKTRQFDW